MSRQHVLAQLTNTLYTRLSVRICGIKKTCKSFANFLQLHLQTQAKSYWYISLLGEKRD